jgi:hypothetical protein
MAFNREHPSPGQPHPWTDPFAPPDLFNRRPDWAFHEAGALAPRPEDFELTERGKQEYYAATERVAREQMAMRSQMAMHQHMAMQEELAHREQVRDAATKLRQHLLLLRK